MAAYAIDSLTFIDIIRDGGSLVMGYLGQDGQSYHFEMQIHSDVFARGPKKYHAAKILRRTEDGVEWEHELSWEAAAKLLDTKNLVTTTARQAELLGIMKHAIAEKGEPR